MSKHQDPLGLVGAVLAHKYRIDALVGEGGFGVVYRAFHLGLKHDVAVKCLKIPAHFTSQAQELFAEKFREEGQRSSALSSAHLSIVRVFDFDVTSSPRGASVPFLVLEWLEGRSVDAMLDDRRRRGQGGVGEIDALAILRPAVDALAVAHRRAIAHRDIKPANLFLVGAPRGQKRGEQGPGTSTLKVLDFGIAKAMQEGETATRLTTRTNSGFSAFSPQHAAPEQFWSKKFGATGPWTDVHGLGLCLIELVRGQPAMDGEEQGDFFDASTNERRPTPKALGLPVSDVFEALCGRAVALMPKDRFQNAAELLDALDAAGAAIGLPQVGPSTVAQVPAGYAFGSAQDPPTQVAPDPPAIAGSGPPRPLLAGEASASNTPLAIAVSTARPAGRSSRWAVAAAFAVLVLGGGALAQTRARAARPSSPTQSEAANLQLAAATASTVDAMSGVVETSPPAASADRPRLRESAAQATTDAWVPKIGELVIVKSGVLSFSKGKVQGVKRGLALVDEREIPVADLSPMALPGTQQWSVGDVILVLKAASGPILVGVVSHVRIDDQLTVEVWEGAAKAAAELIFSPPQSLKPGQRRLADAIPVRPAWSEPLRAELVAVKAQTAAAQRAEEERAEAARVEIERKKQEAAEVARAEIERKKRDALETERKRAECLSDPECKRKLDAVAAAAVVASEAAAAAVQAAVERCVASCDQASDPGRCINRCHGN